MRTEALPEVKDTVLVYGYPQGGATLSVTKGIVSRIEFAGYGEGTSGVRVQVDAAINPGNSGGPAIVDGKMVGLIFSKLGQADNIGYIIPSEEIDLFLKDVADGSYDGKPRDPRIAADTRKRRAAVVSEARQEDSGNGRPLHRSQRAQRPAQAIRRADQDRRPRDRQRGHGQDQRQFAIEFSLLDPEGREGRQGADDRGARGEDDADRRAGKAEVSDPDQLAQGAVSVVFHLRPAGVFAGHERVCSRTGEGRFYRLALIGSPLALRRGDLPKFEGEELVVVSSPMFPHRIGKGYDDPFSKIVKEVNGVRIKNLRHFVEVLRDSKEKFTRISFDDKISETIVLDHQEALKATDEILSDNGIRDQASDDLSAVWSKKK